MNKAIKWLVIICIIGWAAHNPGQVAADVHSLLAAGESLVTSVSNALGGAVSGVAGGGH